MGSGNSKSYETLKKIIDLRQEIEDVYMQTFNLTTIERPKHYNERNKHSLHCTAKSELLAELDKIIVHVKKLGLKHPVDDFNKKSLHPLGLHIKIKKLKNDDIDLAISNYSSCC